MTQGGSLAYLSIAGSGSGSGSGSKNSASASSSSKSKTREKPGAVAGMSMCTACNSAASPTCLSSGDARNGSASRKGGLYHFDLELRQIDSTSELADHREADMDMAQDRPGI
ncbi:hypothetical protein E4U41_006314 [Claviceps citrina]|nr:hypothetical protein E4U41_006314 [Claviceps citrina]